MRPRVGAAAAHVYNSLMRAQIAMVMFMVFATDEVWGEIKLRSRPAPVLRKLGPIQKELIGEWSGQYVNYAFFSDGTVWERGDGPARVHGYTYGTFNVNESRIVFSFPKFTKACEFSIEAYERVSGLYDTLKLRCGDSKFQMKRRSWTPRRM